MKHQQPSQKRQTIRIKLPPKPAAPRHSQAIARAIPMPSASEPAQKKESPFVFPMVQVTGASILAMMMLDGGFCSQIVLYAALGYAGGLVMMAPRREALTRFDAFLIRWGFLFLCVIAFFVTQMVGAILIHRV